MRRDPTLEAQEAIRIELPYDYRAVDPHKFIEDQGWRNWFREKPEMDMKTLGLNIILRCVKAQWQQ